MAKSGKPKKPESKNSVGAPRKDIDWKSIDALCGLDATLEYCAEAQLKKWDDEINIKTITACRKLISRRIFERFECDFATYKDQKKEPRRISLKQKMWELALKGNVTLMIWLSKNEMGMHDHHEPPPPPKEETPERNVIVYQTEWGKQGEPGSGTGT